MGAKQSLSSAALGSTLLALTIVATAQEPRSAPPILTRGSWGARPALSGLEQQRIVGIIIHHTAVRRNTHVPFPTKLRNLQTYSQQHAEFAPGRRKPVWPDVPYHFYIDANGTIAEGRDVRFAGSTNTNYNPSGFVQVALEGNFEVEQPTPVQLDALKAILAWQSRTHGVSLDMISTHRQHASTICPGKNLVAALPGVLSNLKIESPK